MSSQALIIFAKQPVLGNVKSRVAKSVGEEKALEIYEHLLQRTWEQIFPWAGKRGVSVFVYWDSLPKFSLLNPSPFSLPGQATHRLQSSGDLGERMYTAFQEVLSQFSKAVIVGTDCPWINEEILEEAFAPSLSFPVIGPALDGGYYLLGLENNSWSFFEGISWSTDQVFFQTLERFRSAGLELRKMPVLRDIDTMEDWLVWEKSR